MKGTWRKSGVSRTLPWLRRLLAAGSFATMLLAFVAPALAAHLGFLPRLQFLPALFAGAALELVLIAVATVLCGRLYCSLVCPLGIAQDLVRALPRRLLRLPSPRPLSRRARAGRLAVLGLFVFGACFGLAGLLAPYGLFGRFLAVGVLRTGEPGVLARVVAVGLVAFVLAAGLVRARWWCNRICPVGTFLGLCSRFAVFRVRIDAAKCVRCGMCAKRCDKGALTVRDDKSVAVDAESCVACFNCAGSCRTGALRWISGKGNDNEKSSDR